MEPINQTPQPPILQNAPPAVAPAAPAPTQNHCNRCHSEINESFYFCPHCGHKIIEPPYHFSIISTIGILLIAFLFPPFGLIPGFRYLKNKDSKAKLVGVLVVVVTIISSIIFIYAIRLYVNYINQTVNTINSMTAY